MSLWLQAALDSLEFRADEGFRTHLPPLFLT
jgi:hypothetical protein